MLKKLFRIFIHELEKLMDEKNKIFISHKIINPNSVQKINLQNIIIYDSTQVKSSSGLSAHL